MSLICQTWTAATRLPRGWLDPAVTANRDQPVAYLARKDALDQETTSRWIPPEELERSARLRHPDDRKRFLVGRAMLRTLVGDHLGIAPRELELSYSPAGKPRLAAFPGPAFNLAHAGDWILLSLHPRAQVGVDIERVRPEAEMQSIAERMFSSDLIAQFHGASAKLRPTLFFRAWTRLEATLKAEGHGLPASDAPKEADMVTRCIELTAPVDYVAACAWI